MQLIGVEVQGFRRFGDLVSVRLLEDLVAVVGQNESGKTSLLEAIEEFNTQEEIAKRNQTRRLDTPTVIQATFRLEKSDWKELQHIDGGESIETCVLSKYESGRIEVELDPKPIHDLEPRKSVHSKLDRFLESNLVEEKFSNKATRNLRSVVGNLESENDHLGKELIDQIEARASDIENILDNADSEEFDIESANDLTDSLMDLAQHERDCAPHKARETLRQCRPRFLKFTEADRDISSTYDLNEEVPNPSKALRNLAKLADLDLKNLKDAAVSENIALRDDLIEEANETLKDHFSKAWVRSDVYPILGADGTVLYVNVSTPDEQNRAPIDQRSEGLLWFVALLAFLNQEDARDPVLLVDEAESHLSYDAQAELIEVLETQNVAQKVIYTTHSAGCLPSDLGRGIRPVVQKEGERSDIKNCFWTEEPGFKPIMVAMGLNPLAFTVTRNSLIAEGPSETILLPTLIRQATGKSELNYQIAPGAANVGNEKVPELLSETGRSLVLLDGDDAGIKTKKNLVNSGVEEQKIKTYKDFVDDLLVLEDLLDPEIYAEAVNDELQTFQNVESELTSANLPDAKRVNAVEEWCKEQGLDAPMKPNVCQRLVKYASKDVKIVDSARVEVLKEIDEWAEDQFIFLNG